VGDEPVCFQSVSGRQEARPSLQRAAALAEVENHQRGPIGAMTNKIDCFIDEIRARPEFVAAAASDPKWDDELDELESTHGRLYHKPDPELIEAFDKIHAVVGRGDLYIKYRLLELNKFLAQARDAIIIVH
jgi:hypothetical protein